MNATGEDDAAPAARRSHRSGKHAPKRARAQKVSDIVSGGERPKAKPHAKHVKKHHRAEKHDARRSNATSVGHEAQARRAHASRPKYANGKPLPEVRPARNAPRADNATAHRVKKVHKHHAKHAKKVHARAKPASGDDGEHRKLAESDGVAGHRKRIKVHRDKPLPVKKKDETSSKARAMITGEKTRTKKPEPAGARRKLSDYDLSLIHI